MPKPYQDHLSSSRALQTTYEAVRSGFVALALEKNRRATPFVAQARALKAAATLVKTPAGLAHVRDIQPAMLTAAGVSDKAAGHLEESDKTEAIQGLIANFLEPAGANFVEELVFRFLLTRGDSLGGSMRNAGGFMAQCKLTRSILAHLRNAGHAYRWLHAKTNQWTDMSEDDADIELSLGGMAWKVGQQSRTLLYNITVPLVKNKIDLTLFNCEPDANSELPLRNASAYLALGELKGGIDPAGADEHWKTARTALGRIHAAFAKRKVKPMTFFIGAAIEAKMADEIWTMLKKRQLDNAANLTDENHLASITRWLGSL